MTAADKDSSNVEPAQESRPYSGSNGSSSLPDRPRSRTMPNYYHSNEPTAVKKLRRTQEQEINQEMVALREEKKLQVFDLQNEAKKAMRKVPLDILTTEWLTTTVDTVELRSYLVDAILPQLVLGLEKLLMEADRRGLPYMAEKRATKLEMDTEKQIELNKVEAIIGDLRGDKGVKRPEEDPSFDPDFNPLNYLARYLMRNNPRFNNQAENSPYARGLRCISQQLKQKVFSSEENRLAAIKMEAKKKREEREERERARLAELSRKQKQLSGNFFAWVYSPAVAPPKNEMDANELVQMAYIQNVLRSFEELVQKLPPEMQENARFAAEIEPTDTTGSTLDQWQFEKFLMKYVHDFSHDMFDLFMSHLEMCSGAYHEANRVTRRHKIYTDLFNYLDTNRQTSPNSIGYINRNVVISLLEMFWRKCNKEKRALMRDPRKWPVVEITESREDVEDPVEEEEEAEEDAGEADEKRDSSEEQADEEGGSGDQLQEGVVQEEDTVKTEGGAEEAKVDKTVVEEGKGDTQEESPSKDDNVNTQTGEEQEAPQKSPQPVETADEPDSAAVQPTEVENTVEVGGGDAVAGTAPVADEQKQDGEGPEGEGRTGNGDEEDEETASVKEERNIIEEIKAAELERDRTDKLQEELPREQTEPFHENMLTRDQFVLLVENFLGERCEDKLLYSFISYIRTYYLEGEPTKLERLTKLNSTAKEKFNTYIVENLFSTWDSDAKGYIEVPQFINVAEKYKGGAEQEALELGLDDVGAIPDNQLSQDLFVDLVMSIAQHLTDGEDQLPAYVQFLSDSVDKSHEEKIRGLARKKWLDEITAVAQKTGNLEAVYKSVFNALYKDAEAHGRNKKISANICMLESNPTASSDNPDIPSKLLRCVAATVEDAAFMLGQHITQQDPNVSFPAMTQKELIHVPKVKSHGSVHFWSSRRSDKDGSLIVCPLLDNRRNAYGTLAIDTLRTQNRENRIFLQHELAFVQGVAQRFHQAFTLIDVKRRSLKVVESCIQWIKLNCASVRECTFYLVESDPVNTSEPFTLRMMLGSGYQGVVTYFVKTKALALQDNMFKEYLYKAVANSETVVAEMRGEMHMAVPVRDPQGFSRSLLDINMGPQQEQKMNKLEKVDLLTMLKIQQDAFIFMAEEAQGKTSTILQIEKDMGPLSVEILFERMMLQEMRVRVKQIGADTFAEIKSYAQPPHTVTQIVDILIEMFLSRRKDQFTDWNSKKLVLSAEMLKKVAVFDPTEPTTMDVHLLRQMLNGIEKERVAQMGPFPAQTLYNWMTVAIALMEHAQEFRAGAVKKMKKQQPKKQLSGEIDGTLKETAAHLEDEETQDRVYQEEVQVNVEQAEKEDD